MDWELYTSSLQQNLQVYHRKSRHKKRLFLWNWQKPNSRKITLDWLLDPFKPRDHYHTKECVICYILISYKYKLYAYTHEQIVPDLALACRCTWKLWVCILRPYEDSEMLHSSWLQQASSMPGIALKFWNRDRPNWLGSLAQKICHFTNPLTKSIHVPRPTNGVRSCGVKWLCWKRTRISIWKSQVMTFTAVRGSNHAKDHKACRNCCTHPSQFGVQIWYLKLCILFFFDRRHSWVQMLNFKRGSRLGQFCCNLQHFVPNFITCTTCTPPAIV